MSHGTITGTITDLSSDILGAAQDRLEHLHLPASIAPILPTNLLPGHRRTSRSAWWRVLAAVAVVAVVATTVLRRRRAVSDDAPDAHVEHGSSGTTESGRRSDRAMSAVDSAA